MCRCAMLSAAMPRSGSRRATLHGQSSASASLTGAHPSPQQRYCPTALDTIGGVRPWLGRREKKFSPTNTRTAPQRGDGKINPSNADLPFYCCPCHIEIPWRLPGLKCDEDGCGGGRTAGATQGATQGATLAGGRAGVDVRSYVLWA